MEDLALNTTPLSAFIFTPHQNARPRQRPRQRPLSTQPQDKHAVKLKMLLLRISLPTVLSAQQATSVPPLTMLALLITAEPLRPLRMMGLRTRTSPIPRRRVFCCLIFLHNVHSTTNFQEPLLR